MFLIIAAVWMSACLLTDGHTVVKRNSTTRRKRQVSTCTDGYEDVPGPYPSSMCQEDSPLYQTGSAGVDAETKATILQLHNQYRQEVDAKRMFKLYWDDELARVAEKWARQCKSGHEEDHGLSRYIPLFGTRAGQNKASGQRDFATAVTDAWQGEKSDFTFGVPTNKVVGHYTQIMNANSILIGCGYAKCDDKYGHYYACNYMTGQYSFTHPYVPGTPCSDCQDNCVNGKLCDCGGKFCSNGGKLNLKTCECTCTEFFKGDQCRTEVCPGISHCSRHGTLKADSCECECSYPIWTGDRCQTVSCPDEDPGICGSLYLIEECTTWQNYPWECPYMCEFKPCSN